MRDLSPHVRFAYWVLRAIAEDQDPTTTPNDLRGRAERAASLLRRQAERDGVQLVVELAPAADGETQ